MTRKNLVKVKLLILVLIGQNYGQVQFQVHTLFSGWGSPRGVWDSDVYTADIDGDGDMDVISAGGWYVINSSSGAELVWYENDGQANFTKHVITSHGGSLSTPVHATDIDSDGDMDVLSGNWEGVILYKNDGQANFTKHVITSLRACSIHTDDVDGDGDMDVLCAESGGGIKGGYVGSLTWYENDGLANFTAHMINSDALGARSVYARDLDGDGDTDVLLASDLYNEIAWYENDGQANFTNHVITTDALGAESVYATDVDGDGDMDVLSASAWDNKIAWYENVGHGGFTIHMITTDALGAESVYATDVDGDGDMDVLSASGGDGKIIWYENDGQANFTTHMITTDALGACSIHTADVDGDGDMDVLSASSKDGKIVWYEQLTLTPVESQEKVLLEHQLYDNFPNPFNPSTTISYDLRHPSEVNILVYDIWGQKVATLVSENQAAGCHAVEWNGLNAQGKAVGAGMYLYVIRARDFAETRRMLLLK